MMPEDKPIKIRPRKTLLASGDKKGDEHEGGGEYEEGQGKKTGRIQPTGIPFEARAQSKSRGHRDPEKPADAEAGQGDEPKQNPEPTRSEKAAVQSPPAEAPQADPAPSAPRKNLQWPSLWAHRVRLGPAILVLLLPLALTAGISYWLGGVIERAGMIARIERQGVPLPVDFQARLDQALGELRTGDPQKSLDQLVVLEKEAPGVSSLSYLVALAAMQAGNPELSFKMADASIARNERVSDSLALKAVLETQKSHAGTGGMGDPKIRAESYLREAMVADAANPYPMIELGSLLRYRKQNEEARKLFQGARLRLNPVDSRMVADVSLELMDLGELPDDKLPPEISDPSSTQAFAAAYLALRRSQPDRATEILQAARHQLPDDVFYYLVNDPLIRKYSREPALKEFFE